VALLREHSTIRPQKVRQIADDAGATSGHALAVGGAMFGSSSRRALLVSFAATCALPGLVTSALAQPPLVASVHLLPAPTISFPAQVDSNSPVVVDNDGATVRLFNSALGEVRIATGTSIETLGPSMPVTWTTRPAGGIWMESVLPDDNGTLYGYYHNEVLPPECPGSDRVRPRIGAARSEDQGMTWEDLGVILESSEPSLCETTNLYDVGGVGDFSAILDRRNQFVYVFYSEYGPSLEAQGVAVARMPWAGRDQPVGALDVWSGGVWLPADESVTSTDDGETIAWSYPTGTPVYPARISWHSPDGTADAMWGPSVHWNTFLNEYVMLLDHADSVGFDTEGIYVAYARTLERPTEWSAPLQLLSGGGWYPQVLGLTVGSLTDRMAGQLARFYMSGTSISEIEFGSVVRKAAPSLVPDVDGGN
jgi:hypothetical protein